MVKLYPGLDTKPSLVVLNQIQVFQGASVTENCGKNSRSNERAAI